MNLVMLRYGNGVPAVFGFEHPVALPGEIDFECGAYVFVVITDKNCVHIFASVKSLSGKALRIKPLKY